ncbi:hypothetical protein [Methanolobus sp.]|uniref:hypothetical protein n=1 Tax=Methanolobus sp. TaxID=1874737 RepID=UPI0025DB9090|nr:hypothetical protein [Methanolobus sp.]
MTECELLSKCGFFKKHQSNKESACKGFIAMYCKGTKMEACKRKIYRKENGVAPSDDMLPTGHMMKA